MIVLSIILNFKDVNLLDCAWLFCSGLAIHGIAGDEEHEFFWALLISSHMHPAQARFVLGILTLILPWVR